ncbi:8-oxoguanine deaminase [Komagataeibacter kakiaceti JCM 25156]
MIDLLIHDAWLYIDRGWEIPGGWIAINGGRVHGVGGPELPRPQARRVIDARGRLVTPGLVNAHHHMWQNLTRAYAPVTRRSLFSWLEKLFPLWAMLDADAVYLASYVGMVELLLGGCTTAMDQLYAHPAPGLTDAQFRAARDVGLRFYATRGSITRTVEERGLAPAAIVQDEDTVLTDCERLVHLHHDPRPGALGRVALGPAALYLVSERIMRESVIMAERHNLRLHTHLAEDVDEDEYCLNVYGCTPTEYLEHLGWATPRTWVAHYIYAAPAEIDRMARAGVAVVQCPGAGMLTGGGSADAMALRARGVHVGVGSNGAASNDTASMWMETRNAMLLGRSHNGPESMGARDALDMATRGSAACLGWADEIGHLCPGACADLVLWHMSDVALAGAVTDPVEAWLRCGPAVAHTTIVNGRVLVENCEPRQTGLTDVLRAHAAQARRIQEAGLND